MLGPRRRCMATGLPLMEAERADPSHRSGSGERRLDLPAERGEIGRSVDGGESCVADERARVARPGSCPPRSAPRPGPLRGLSRTDRRVPCRGVIANNIWLHHRAAALNLRRLINLGLTRTSNTWHLAPATA